MLYYISNGDERLKRKSMVECDKRAADSRISLRPQSVDTLLQGVLESFNIRVEKVMKSWNLKMALIS